MKTDIKNKTYLIFNSEVDKINTNLPISVYITLFKETWNIYNKFTEANTRNELFEIMKQLNNYIIDTYLLNTFIRDYLLNVIVNTYPEVAILF